MLVTSIHCTNVQADLSMPNIVRLIRILVREALNSTFYLFHIDFS